MMRDNLLPILNDNFAVWTLRITVISSWDKHVKVVFSLLNGHFHTLLRPPVYHVKAVLRSTLVQ
jgi:hypothetical protein